MFYYNRSHNSIEVDYPWFKPICAKLTLSEEERRYVFSFNRNYLRVSKLIGGGWRLISIMRALLQMDLVRNDMIVIHGGGVRIGEEGILMPSVENTGKTSTVWMLARHGAGFITDEYSILDKHGQCYGIAGNSSVTPATARALGLKLPRRKRIPLALAGLKGKILTVHFSSGGTNLSPDGFFRICDKTRITRLAIIQSGSEFTRRINLDEALAKLKAIQAFEFGWRNQPYLLAYSYFNPHFDISSLASREDSLLSSILLKVQNFYLISSANREQYKAIENLALADAKEAVVAPNP